MDNEFNRPIRGKRIRYTETGGKRKEKDREGMGTGRGVPLSVVKEGTKQEDFEKKFEELQEKVTELEGLINDMKKDTRQYTQTEVYTGKVVFRGEVYNKAGTKVIN